MRSRLLLLLVPATALLLLGAKKIPHRAVIPETIGPTIVPQANLFLRNAPDTDPSSYIGRFIPDNMTLFDDTNGSKRTCSRFITQKVVGGGNFARDELFSASASAVASWGLPVIADVKIGGGTTNVIRVSYVLTNKMTSDISDPAGFDACCKQYPDQCTGRYLGEFLEGTGTVWHSVSKGAGVTADVTTQYGIGKLDARFGTTWQSAAEFTTPVYFAFKSVDTGITAVTQGCGSWMDTPPTSSAGKYFVGTSEPVSTEKEARDRAMLHSRTQAVQYVGVAIQQGQIETATTSGQRSQLASSLTDTAFVESVASGLAAYVKDEQWCVKPSLDGRYDTWVLAFLPTEDTAKAAQSLLGAVPKSP